MMRRTFAARLDERSLRVLFALFFLALAIPALLLVRHAYSQLNWQTFRQTQVLAEDLTTRLDAELASMIANEQARSFGDYAFLVVEGDPAAGFVQRSPLSAVPVDSALPGALGYFQVNADGELSTPLLPPSEVDPQAYGISSEERARRLMLESSVRNVLVRNALLAEEESQGMFVGASDDVAEAEASLAQTGQVSATERASAEDALAEIVVTGARIRRTVADSPAQSAFDRLSVSSAPQPDSIEPPASDSAESRERLSEFANLRQPRTEQTVVPEPHPVFSVSTFMSEIDPFEFTLLDTGHLMLFRRVWREDSRLIQGVLIDQGPFLAATVERAFRASSLWDAGALTVIWDRRALATFGATAADGYAGAAAVGVGAPAAGATGLTAEANAPAAGATGLATDANVPLYQARLSPPFGAFELSFALHELPRGPGGPLLGWVTFALLTVLTVGFMLMYRFAVGQVRLARQQQDFVSAVSHELKTPLTSIRMYGEMLKAGWADEERRQSYYDYIHTESERLSRLIDNVLQLARMTRRQFAISPETVSVAELADMIRSKVASQVSRAGFDLAVTVQPDCESLNLRVDRDAFAQIMINLVDNALKFAADASRKSIDIDCRRDPDTGVVFTVRDFGPGVPRAQMKKIFELFYRPDEVLTRQTPGTGIGLALVRQLADAMDARVDVRNREPGAEFSVRFPARHDR